MEASSSRGSYLGNREGHTRQVSPIVRRFRYYTILSLAYFS
ncbi:hypothetical protein MTR67_032028 [Solanum verrucosum]|uniref:Uncharacterized protein n=1 Tax=Solanum verrucosum TaxID=315347 RepID=A0AAF0ZH92_SOLVR|nr:hypothetical protein MTR67_032028 [Solanum verrucosum]